MEFCRDSGLFETLVRISRPDLNIPVSVSAIPLLFPCQQVERFFRRGSGGRGEGERREERGGNGEGLFGILSFFHSLSFFLFLLSVTLK